MQIINRFPLFVFLLLELNIPVFCQEVTTSVHGNSVLFADYLIRRGLYDEALQALDILKSGDPCTRDSFLYYKGWAYYNMKELNPSAEHLMMVSPNSPFYYKAQFFASYNLAYLGELSKASDILDALVKNDTVYQELASLERAGIALLDRNLNAYNSSALYLKGNDFRLAEAEQYIKQFAEEIQKFPRKSAILAAIMSAVVPGSGKIYAGKTGEGISAFLTVSILALVAGENYFKAGIGAARTMIFGSLFCLSYAANIYGSVYAVKAYRNEFYKTMDYRILFHMHIPLRNIFN